MDRAVKEDRGRGQYGSYRGSARQAGRCLWQQPAGTSRCP